jgi:lactoylglutathione lyase
MAIPMQLAHFMMHVSDLEASIAFYEAALHFKVAERHRYDGHNLAYLRRPGTHIELELVQPDKSTPRPIERSTTWHIAFVVDDLSVEFARFSALGIPLEPIQDYVANREWQTWFFYAYDPDGHQIEILERRGRYAQVTDGGASAIPSGA